MMVQQGLHEETYLKSTIHTLVESPTTVNGDPVKVKGLLAEEEGLDSTLQQTGVGNIKLIAFFLQQLDKAVPQPVRPHEKVVDNRREEKRTLPAA